MLDQRGRAVVDVVASGSCLIRLLRSCAAARGLAAASAGGIAPVRLAAVGFGAPSARGFGAAFGGSRTSAPRRALQLGRGFRQNRLRRRLLGDQRRRFRRRGSPAPARPPWPPASAGIGGGVSGLAARPSAWPRSSSGPISRTCPRPPSPHPAPSPWAMVTAFRSLRHVLDARSPWPPAPSRAETRAPSTAALAVNRPKLAEHVGQVLRADHDQRHDADDHQFGPADVQTCVPLLQGRSSDLVLFAPASRPWRRRVGGFSSISAVPSFTPFLKAVMPLPTSPISELTLPLPNRTRTHDGDQAEGREGRCCSTWDNPSDCRRRCRVAGVSCTDPVLGPATLRRQSKSAMADLATRAALPDMYADSYRWSVLPALAPESRACAAPTACST